MEEMLGALEELESQRAEVRAVQAALQAEASARFAANGGHANIGDLAVAIAQAREALRKLDWKLSGVRAAIIEARLAAGEKPDCPPGVVSAWAPFLGPRAADLEH